LMQKFLRDKHRQHMIMLVVLLKTIITRINAFYILSFLTFGYLWHNETCHSSERDCIILCVYNLNNCCSVKENQIIILCLG
jgi:hypothetical protein